MPLTQAPSTTTVWHRFPARDSTLRVQQLTPDLYEPAIQLLKTYYTRDEPMCKYIGFENSPVAMDTLEQVWRKILKDNVSLVCLVDDGLPPRGEDGLPPRVADDGLPPQVVGVNILAVLCQDDKHEPLQTDDKICAQFFGAIDLVLHGVDIFQRYGVQKYMMGCGLVVAPEWRGLGVATEMMRARINLSLCRSLGIKVTATVFTAKASQMAAKKVGFVDLYELTYEELAKKGCVFPGIEEHTKSSKLMALVIDED